MLYVSAAATTKVNVYHNMYIILEDKIFAIAAKDSTPLIISCRETFAQAAS